MQKKLFPTLLLAVMLSAGVVATSGQQASASVTLCSDKGLDWLVNDCTNQMGCPSTPTQNTCTMGISGGCPGGGASYKYEYTCGGCPTGHGHSTGSQGFCMN
jgi:hypothetical protein